MGTKIMAELIFEFNKDVEFDEISSYLGVYPQDTIYMQTRSKLEGYKKHKRSWFVDTGYIETVELINVLKELLSRLEGKEKLINEILDKYEGESLLSIVPIISIEQKPVLIFENSVIEFLHKIGADIHFDLYFED